MEKSASQQTTMRFVIIAGIVLALIIPLSMIRSVTDERQGYFEGTFHSIAQAWGTEQAVSGPFLIIPETHAHQVKNDDGTLEWRHVKRQRVLLPAELDIAAEIEHQYRHRAIYKVPVYIAKLKFRGNFSALNPELMTRKNVEVHLDDAQLVMGISHTQAIVSVSPFKQNTAGNEFNSGTQQNWLGSGIHSPVAQLSATEASSFSFELALKGTGELGLTPIGNINHIGMQSTWPHPSFSGIYLPTHYEISNTGFSANWDVHKLARNLPDSWQVDKLDINLSENLARVSLFQPVTNYKIIDRAIKYGLLFIALTFLAFVCFELNNKLQFHIVQYGAIGANLVLFFLILLSLSEHISFSVSYICATILTTTLNSSYVWAMTKSKVLCLWITSIVTGLYATLFVLLKMETFALLVGTAVLLIGLVALMFTTRGLAKPRALLSTEAHAPL